MFVIFIFPAKWKDFFLKKYLITHLFINWSFNTNSQRKWSNKESLYMIELLYFCLTVQLSHLHDIDWLQKRVDSVEKQRRDN